MPLERPVACGLWAVFTERRGVAPPFRRSLTGSCAATLEVLRAVWNALACASFFRVRSPSRTVSEAVGQGCVRATRCIHDAHTRTFTGGSTTIAWYDRTELPPTAAEETTSVENSVGRLVVREPRTAAPLYPFRYKQVRRLEDKLRTLEAEGIPASRVVVVGRYLRKPCPPGHASPRAHLGGAPTVRWAASRKVAVSRCSSPTEGRRSASGPWAAHSARLFDAVINTGVFRQAPLSPEQETSRLGEAEKVAAQVAKIRAELDALKKQAQAGLTLDQLHVRKGLKHRSKSTPTAPVVLEPSSPATYQKATGKWHKELFRLDA